MSDFGVTEDGFNRKRLEQIEQELGDDFKTVFGENFNVSPQSPDGQIIGTLSESFANLWEIVEGAYNSYNPSATVGVGLSSLVQINNITRNPDIPSRVEVTITGVASTLIPSGSIISVSDTKEQFTTDIDVIIGGGGTVDVFCTSVNTGEIIALAGTLTDIGTPIAGWSSVTNDDDAITGSDEETDVELRVRRSNIIGLASTNNIDSIFAGVSNVQGVTKTVVYENDTDIIDVNLLPPHSFEVVVSGGLDADIATVIWTKKPSGVFSNGTTTEQILDSQGFTKDISFTRPAAIEIDVEVNITTLPGYPGDGDDKIKQAIVDYANGVLVEGRSFDIGDDVIRTELYTAINSVDNLIIETVKIAILGDTLLEQNLSIDIREKSNFDIVNIAVI